MVWWSLIFLILLFTKPNIEVSGWLYQTKTHFTHIIVYQPFSRVSPPIGITSILIIDTKLKHVGNSYIVYILLDLTKPSQGGILDSNIPPWL